MKPEEEIQSIVLTSIEAFKGISGEEWKRKPSPSNWSKKEILGHLVDSALTNLRRFVLTQYEQKSKIVYHQDQWVALQNYQEADAEELIELWRLLNHQLIRVIMHLPADRLDHMCDTGKESVRYHTLEFLIRDYVEHLKHHLAQIIGSKAYLE